MLSSSSWVLEQLDDTTTGSFTVGLTAGLANASKFVMTIVVFEAVVVLVFALRFFPPLVLC